MWPESSEQQQPLRTGLTTGTCATACCLAAGHLLLGDQQKTSVSVTLPTKKSNTGQPSKQVNLELTVVEKRGLGKAYAATVKDAGDDPDATHGATIWVDLNLVPQPGIEFIAGTGVGTVTRSGLLLTVGQAAINPVPRQMMSQQLTRLAEFYQYTGGFAVTIGVLNGVEIAKKTMNGRLGILGGLSILGTSGIVRPYSCSAWIASIHQGLDVAVANNLDHVAAATGNASEAFISQHYGLDDMQLIEMGDFAGAVIKHLKKSPVKRLSICGGFGKISKLADGYMDLHSSRSSINLPKLAHLAHGLGADSDLVSAIEECNTSLEALDLCQQQGINLAHAVCQNALIFAQQSVPNSVQLEVFAVNRQGQLLGCAR
ncbi:MAG: cobalt-precorrin-5B (C(1))-methyltransferase [Oceanospirillaceae bacterium]|jgi:cobalt-precorrin-5B (C1)-methyltransferase|nr:cobalt-precorrin-5B (C(1))-methyltransferase [Oceanospirillaceae bacterium]MBT4442245.1 cobalt-precorrin-5B (C(1))-methyltransferase [Oceanospirillaceae bacterium]MBT6078504.1 cobalt-precorrin-5B (C(1))-methyltransferase [Oceanospirillaceae bacterium]